MHKVLPSTALYYKPRRHLPVLLRTTRLAQSTSQFYFVLQNLHKRLPSTTLHCKACAEHVPVLLRTTKLAQRRCTEKLAHGELLHKEAFTQRHFYTETILHRDSFAHKTFARGNLYTEKFLHVASFCTQHAFIQSKLLHTGSFYTLQSFTHRKLSHTLGYTPKGEDEMRWNHVMSCYVIMLSCHVGMGGLWSWKFAGTFAALIIGLFVGHPPMMRGMAPCLYPLIQGFPPTHTHTTLTHRKPLYIQRSFSTEKFWQRNFCTQQTCTDSKLSHTEAFTQRGFYTELKDRITPQVNFFP